MHENRYDRQTDDSVTQGANLLKIEMPTKCEDIELKQIQRIFTFLYSLILLNIHFKVNSFLHNSVVT